MADTPTRREWEQARLAGETARRAGRPITACPPYGSGHKGEVLREAWRDRWQWQYDKDMERADQQRKGR